MKHCQSGTRKVIKQLENCSDIKNIRPMTNGYMIMANNGEKYVVHFSDRAFHPLRRWLKHNTKLQDLSF